MHNYDQGVARSYAAYRPPLHGRILDLALSRQRFALGLDIGCGTGQSAHALARFCQRVIGTDTSASMLADALPHAGIEYRLSQNEQLPILPGDIGDGIEIVTLAGVLPYLDAHRLVSELGRIGKPDALILVYDFKVDLTPLEQAAGLDARASSDAYDHSANLDGASGIRTETKVSFQTVFDAKPADAAHLLLSSHRRYQMLAARYGCDDPLQPVSEAVAKAGSTLRLRANLWYAAHRRSDGSI
ncbi:MAG: methyltransferase domain-containing protein [Pseudomonadota bacterium]